MRGCQREIAAIVIALLSAAIPFSETARADGWRVTVKGGDIDLGETPLIALVQDGLAKGVYQLDDESGSTHTRAQVFARGDKQYLGFILPRVERSRTTTFSLVAQSSQEANQARGISLESLGENVRVDLDQKMLTEYRVDSGSKPILFPLIGPTGDSYTRGFPMLTLPGEDKDHPHQRSCWFTYGSVNDVDFWSEGAKAGKIKETRRTIEAAGPVLARISTADLWVAPDGHPVCSDERVVTFYGTEASRVIDFEFKITASNGPVVFGDTKEGMFGIRVASSMDVTRKAGGRITNALGASDEKAWGKASPWVDYAGPVNDTMVGIAVLNHPASFRYPTTWHVRTYGLFAANPFGWHDFGMPTPGNYTLGSGELIAFRYRVILHAGDTKAARVDQAFAAYAKPPAVEVLKN